MKTKLFYLLLLTNGFFACQSKSATTHPPDQKTVATNPVTTAVVSESTGAASSVSVSNDFTIVPGERVGPVNGNTSEADLLRLLGPSAVTAGDTLYGAEGESFIGTTLYKGTADEVQIFYSDADTRLHPTTIRVTPRFTDDEGNAIPNQAVPRWVATTGVRVGATLREVERLNGKPFTLWGFEWDYSGMVSDWQGGKLAPPNKKAFLSVGFGSPLLRTAGQDKAYNDVMGDDEFKSSLYAMQQLNPIVVRIDTELR